MNWSDKKPDAPGWYWCRFPESPNRNYSRPHVVEVIMDEKTGMLQQGFFVLKEYTAQRGEWAGPLEPPNI